MIESEEIIKQLEKRLATFSQDQKVQNVGFVQKNSDGVVVATGLSKVVMGEIVYFKQQETGLVFNLDEDSVSIILLGNGGKIKEGDKITRSEKLLTINASEDMLGRVINPLGLPLDGKPKPKKGKDMPLEKIAPGVVAREPVDTPLKTGIKAVDSMIPIGRGQRELIIGDRALGKTALVIDTIINQRISFSSKKPAKKDKKRVICIYVAIGQKQSSVARLIGKLQEEQAMTYTIIVSANSSDSAALQFLAPFAGIAIAEYFLEKGEDVLIVYDDLTKHAWAYRQLSLVLKRPAGREAYPGDIFYLHSRLLERAVKLNKKAGGGSITALPIIETQAGDISAYIPTNVISITDGQIYLQSDLFNIGVRPAINVGLSVSRVGGAAQTPAVKSVAGKLRLELAQYRELAAFAQFGSELDPATLSQLERGKRITEILKQQQYEPLSEALQILSIWAVTNGYLDDIPVSEIQQFEKEFHEYITTHNKNVLEELSQGSRPAEQTLKQMQKTMTDFKKGFSK